MTKTINQNKLFSTFDLGLTCALLANNFKLLKLDKTKPTKVLFYFQEEDGLEQAVENYFSYDFQVDAQTYWDRIKSIKNRLYSN